MENCEQQTAEELKKQKLKEVHTLLGRTNLSKNETWMFDNYWNNPEYALKKDERGKLWVHKIDSIKPGL